MNREKKCEFRRKRFYSQAQDFIGKRFTRPTDQVFLVKPIKINK